MELLGGELREYGIKQLEAQLGFGAVGVVQVPCGALIDIQGEEEELAEGAAQHARQGHKDHEHNPPAVDVAEYRFLVLAVNLILVLAGAIALLVPVVYEHVVSVSFTGSALSRKGEPTSKSAKPIQWSNQWTTASDPWKVPWWCFPATHEMIVRREASSQAQSMMEQVLLAGQGHGLGDAWMMRAKNTVAAWLTFWSRAGWRGVPILSRACLVQGGRIHQSQRSYAFATSR